MAYSLDWTFKMSSLESMSYDLRGPPKGLNSRDLRESNGTIWRAELGSLSALGAPSLHLSGPLRV